MATLITPISIHEFNKYLVTPATATYTTIVELLLVGLENEPVYNIDIPINIDLTLLTLPGNLNLTLAKDTKIAFKTTEIDLNDNVVLTQLPGLAFIWKCTTHRGDTKYVIDPALQHIDIGSLTQLTLPGHTTTAAPTTTTTTTAAPTTTTTTAA